MYLTNCISCNSIYLYPVFGFKSLHLVKCYSCSLVFDKRAPQYDELSKHYHNYPRLHDLPELTYKRYNELLDKFEKFRVTNNLIDLGCSNGLFLDCAKKRGWNVFGTEFDPDCIKSNNEKGIKVFKSDNLPSELFEIKFDIVTSFEVFEHINNPLNEMNLIKSLLRRGGVLYITTPNFNSISRFILGKKWNIIEYPEHLTYYTPRTLNRIVEKNGFDSSYVITTGFSFSRFKKSIDSTAENNSDEEIRNRIEDSTYLIFLKKAINHFLTYFLIGDAIKAFYIRK